MEECEKSLPMSSSNLNAFGGLGHDDFAWGFGAPHVFYWQVIDAHILHVANAWCRAFFHQRGCAPDRVGVVGARFRRVHNLYLLIYFLT
jgi:hypothetical protein